MRAANYLNKLMQFSLREKITVLLFSVATFIFERLKKPTINTYLVYAALQKNGNEIKKQGDSNVVDTTINGKKTKVFLKRSTSDALVYKQLILEDEYKYVIELFQSKKINLERMIDAGANIGLASVYFKAFFPDAKIIALEPVKNTFERLVKNVESNALKNVQCLEKGLWKSATFLQLDTSFRDSTDWSFRLIESPTPTLNTITTVTVQQILDENNWDYVDYLKIDIEGGEVSVFESAKTVESWLPKVKVLAIEIHDEFNCREAIYKLLKQFNFNYIEDASITIATNNTFLN